MQHVIVGTAGHIDHGKSSLVLALTGTDPDRLREEKERGITIDLGFAHTTEQGTVLSFVDVPGHERFVRNMLAGVGGMDLVMLHVASDESVMPQTREHFEICRLLRVPTGLVVITKTDLADAGMLDVVRLEIQELVSDSFLDGAPVVAVSARTGEGIPALRRTLADLASTARRRTSDGPPRLPIDRVFSMKGFGTVVTGTLLSGRLTHDDELVLQPSGRVVKVRGLHVHGKSQGEAVAGQRVAVNLSSNTVRASGFIKARVSRSGASCCRMPRTSSQAHLHASGSISTRLPLSSVAIGSSCARTPRSPRLPAAPFSIRCRRGEACAQRRASRVCNDCGSPSRMR